MNSVLNKIRAFTLPTKAFILGFYILTMTGLFADTTSKVFYKNPAEYHYNIDFINFYGGAKVAYQKNISKLYDLKTVSRAQFEVTGRNERDFRSLPFVAYFLSPLGDLDFWPALKVFTVFGLMAILACTWLYAKTYKDYVLKLFLVLSFYPLITSVYNGQITLLMATLLGVSIWLLKKDRDLLSGVLLSSIMIKPQFILLVPLLFIVSKQKNKFALGFTIATAVLIVIGMNELGLFYIKDFINFLAITESIEYGTNFGNISTFASFYNLISTTHAFRLNVITCILGSLVFLGLFAKKAHKLNFDLKVTVALMLTLAFAMHSYVQDHILLIYPMLLLWDARRSGLFWLLHIIPLTIYLDIPYANLFIFIIVSAYLLEYGYERFERTSIGITQSWSKIYSTFVKT